MIDRHLDPPDELKGKMEFDRWLRENDLDLVMEFKEKHGDIKGNVSRWYKFVETKYAEYLDTEEQPEDYTTSIAGEEN